MTPEELVAYYQNLLIIQYKVLPNAVANVGLVCEQVVADLIYNQVWNAFDPATAIGEQLDILGSYVGAFRRVAGFSPAVTYFQLPFYADGPTGFGGFADYSDTADPTDFWKLYSTVDTAFILSDGQLSQLMQYLIAVHASDHTNESIDNILETFFGSYATLTDSANMSITYTHQSSDPNVLFALVTFLGKLPNPAGVGVVVVTV